MKKIEAVIFDWAGTTVDYGCMAPIHAMQKAFKKAKLDITLDEIRKPMGMLKIDHIKTILNMDRVGQLFQKTHGRAYHADDVNDIYQSFEKDIFSILDQHTTLIDGILNAQSYLRQQRIKIGSTTGYTKDMVKVVAASAKHQGYEPDHIMAADEVSKGRPFPYMLHQNIAALSVQNTKNVIKIGDTIVDIEEGMNAGCWSIGVVEGSSMMGFSLEEAKALPKQTFKQHVDNVKQQMLAAGAHYVIHSLHELPQIIDRIEQGGN